MRDKREREGWRQREETKEYGLPGPISKAKKI
jgi:hypothetical protein